MASWDKKEEASSPLNHDTGSGGSSGSSSVSSSLWVLRLQNATELLPGRFSFSNTKSFLLFGFFYVGITIVPQALIVNGTLVNRTLVDPLLNPDRTLVDSVFIGHL